MSEIARKPYSSLGRDLFFDLKCKCPSPLFEGSDVAHLMTHTIKLTGYSDANWFDRVNKEPTTSKCRCGREFQYQWFRDGVEASFLDERRVFKPRWVPSECPHCEYDRRFPGFEEGGWMQQDNNGPIVSCPMCNPDGLVQSRRAS